MKTFSEYRTYLNDMPVISEEIHQDIHSVLNSENISPEHKLNQMSKVIRNTIKRGETTGLEDAKPKKGSSRAVFFPSEPTKIHLDGKEAHVHTAMKVAFPGHLDKYNKSGALLGEHQNRVEGDHFLNHQYGIIRETGEHGGVKHFETNHENGVLAPMLHSHDEGHYNHMGRIEPIKAGDFKALTKTPEHPKGITHDELYDHLNHHWSEAHGGKHYGKTKPERLEQISNHPLVEKMHDFHLTANVHPGDLRKANMGVWTHPHTGERHLVISDYGYSNEVAKHYNEARKNQARAMRGY